jgi:hypothetical protein
METMNMADFKESRESIGSKTAETSREIGKALRTLTVSLDVDVSEALKGLKALKREAKEATKALRELEGAQNQGADYVRYKLAVKQLVGDNTMTNRNDYQRMLFTNKTIYNAYANNDADTLELCFGRCSGTTTSIIALMNTFDDVVYIENARNRDVNVTDKVVFIERDIRLPTGVRPKRVIRIRQFEDGRLF